MSLVETEFLDYVKAMFREHGADYDEIQETLNSLFSSSPEKKDELSIRAHFYYFICTPNKKDAREELQIIGLTSLMEAMMSESDHLDPFQYFASKYKGVDVIKSVSRFKEEYLNEHGTGKKVREYLKEYLIEEDVISICNNIHRISEGETEAPLGNSEELAKFLYQMRSEFVHNADMQGLCPLHSDFAILSVGKKVYVTKINISNILVVFEKSFVRYWKEKQDLLTEKKGISHTDL